MRISQFGSWDGKILCSRLDIVDLSIPRPPMMPGPTVMIEFGPAGLGGSIQLDCMPREPLLDFAKQILDYYQNLDVDEALAEMVLEERAAAVGHGVVGAVRDVSK